MTTVDIIKIYALSEHILASLTKFQITPFRPQERVKLFVHALRYQPVYVLFVTSHFCNVPTYLFELSKLQSTYTVMFLARNIN